MYIFHCVRKQEYDRSAGSYGEESVKKCGFIHCSDINTYHLVAPNFKDDPEERILLLINTDKVIPEIRWEESEGVDFPHIYGLLNTDAVEEILPHLWSEERVWIPNEELARYRRTDMRLTAVIEQTHRYQKRMKYMPESGTFVEKEGYSLGYAKGVPYPYGWIKETGTPPQPHLDVYLITGREFELGDEVPVNVIGVFRRADLDHKLVAVLDDRDISDLSELSQEELDALRRLYPGKYEGDAWLGRDGAERAIEEFFARYGRAAT